MTWFWMNVAMLLLLGSLLFIRRKRRRDLHRAPPGQTAIYLWTRTAGIGLAFGATFEILAMLWRSQWTSQLLLSQMLVGMVGLSIWFQLSEIQPKAVREIGDPTRDGYG